MFLDFVRKVIGLKPKVSHRDVPVEQIDLGLPSAQSWSHTRRKWSQKPKHERKRLRKAARKRRRVTRANS